MQVSILLCLLKHSTPLQSTQRTIVSPQPSTNRGSFAIYGKKSQPCKGFLKGCQCQGCCTEALREVGHPTQQYGRERQDLEAVDQGTRIYIYCTNGRLVSNFHTYIFMQIINFYHHVGTYIYFISYWLIFMVNLMQLLCNYNVYVFQYWADKKSAVKKKAALRAAATRRTGGGVEEVVDISEVEERIIFLMGGESFASGDRHLAIDPFSVRYDYL